MLNIKEAIEISRILCKAPEERLAMILAVYEEAGIIISGLEELEEWKSLKDQSGLIDIQEFLEDLETLYPADGQSQRFVVINREPVYLKEVV